MTRKIRRRYGAQWWRDTERIAHQARQRVNR